MANYKVPIEETIINLLETNLGRGIIKDYYFGDPWMIPKTSMPCIIVDAKREGIVQTSTNDDEVTTTVLVKVVMNKVDDFNKPGKEAAVKRKLRQIISGRDPSTGRYSSASIMHILRKNYRLGIGANSQEANVEFNDSTKTPTLIIAEAAIQLTVMERVPVDERV